MTPRPCRKCGSTEKTSDGRSCVPCKKARNRRYEQRNPGRATRWYQKVGGTARLRHSLWYEYGLLLEEYDAMLVRQSGRCAICGSPFEGPNEPHVDHDHSVGVVRELLCLRCNGMIGQARENTNTLRAGADYLERHYYEGIA